MEIEHNPLLHNLVNDAAASTHLLAENKVNFATAMEQMDIKSVFDIIRYSKTTFSQRLAEINDDDGHTAYDNAMCYAVQIGRAYREHVISSGKQPDAIKQSGIRSLIEVGPSYANLFKENWADFCKVGAMEAVDSPVAYLNRLYQMAIVEIESQGQGLNPKILLDKRRPDLKDLLINHQNTYTPVPMLDIVNDVLTKAIEKNHASIGVGSSSVHELLRAKRHPFVFPYHFAHHQAMLGFNGSEHMMLGETNYRISRALPTRQNGENEFGRVEHSAVEAQRLLSGLSPEQQQLLIEPTLFSAFYIERADLEVEFDQAVRLPAIHQALLFSLTYNLGAILPEQPYVGATEGNYDLTSTTMNPGSPRVTVDLTFKKEDGADLTCKITLHQKYGHKHWGLNWAGSFDFTTEKSCGISYQAANNPGIELPTDENYTARFYLICSSYYNLDDQRISFKNYIKQTYTICLNSTGYQLTPEERAFFKSSYGIDVYSAQNNSLVHLGVFMSKTGMGADEVQSLLAHGNHIPRLSPNCPVSGALRDSTKLYPLASHYGASYVNGVGGRDAGSINYNHVDNSMGLVEQAIGDEKVWNLTQTSLNRFDRLQRMIRLQRWMNIPFAELDTLVMSAIRSEREHNLGYELNANTVRTLGVYRYLSERYTIEPEEFAGLLHYVSPFASGERTPLFDVVFNSPALFDTPLVLDKSAFNVSDTDPATQKTIAQLCAGLKLQPTETSFFRLANDTKNLANNGTMRRDLSTVSSLYRQARIAQLFDLSVEDSWALIDLLGGEAYRERVASGRLRPVALSQPTETEEVPDILDILMHMDWAVTWFKQTGQDVNALRRHLGIDQDESGLAAKLESALLDRRAEVSNALESVRELTSLLLPSEDAAGKPIEWISAVLGTSMDISGAVHDQPLSAVGSLDVWLHSNITAQLEEVILNDDPDADAEMKLRISQRLVDHLMKGHAMQRRLIHELLRSSAGVQAERVDTAIRWSGYQVTQLLIAMASTSDTATAVTILLAAVRHADVMHTLALGVPALRTFIANPAKLDHQRPDQPPTLNLANLYLYERYCQWAQSGLKPEDDVLAYFVLANTTPAAGSETEHVQQCAASLATLIGWSSAEVLVATTTLEGQVAKSMQQVDWVRRVHAAAIQSQLSAAALLLATQLNCEVEPLHLKDESTPDSGVDHWSAVGEALMAARR